MYNIMLVDDDSIVRTSIQCLVDWEKHGFRISSTAHNGKQALAKLADNPVDIVITDINMPIMDGLQLTTELLKLENPPQIMVLSAYNEYHLVRKAFKLGVEDYILKNEITADNLLGLLVVLARRIGDALPVESDSQHPQISPWVRDILLGGAFSDSPHCPVCYCLCCFQVEQYKEILLRFGGNIQRFLVQPMTDIAYQAIKQSPYHCFLDMDPSLYVLILFSDKLDGLEERMTQYAKAISQSWKQYLNIHTTGCVSIAHYNHQLLPKLYKETREALGAKYVFGSYGILTQEQISKLDANTAKIKTQQYQWLVAQVFSQHSWGKTSQKNLIHSFDALDDAQHLTEQLYVVWVICMYLERMGESPEAVIGKNANIFDRLLALHTRSDRDIWLTNFLSWIASYFRRHHHHHPEGNQIERARQFIDHNFCDSNISLKGVAQLVDLSEKYFSTLFTQDTGETFTDYLTRLRMERAKHLFANKEYKVYEIGFLVGYNSVEHFSRSFKKYSGMSPSEYSARLQPI